MAAVAQPPTVVQKPELLIIKFDTQKRRIKRSAKAARAESAPRKESAIQEEKDLLALRAVCGMEISL